MIHLPMKGAVLGSRGMFLLVISVYGLVLFSSVLFLTGADAEEINCIACHAQLAGEKVVHAAVKMGCQTCHTAIDAGSVPHKKTGKADRGLSATLPDLCFGCHDQSKFRKRNVHAALGMGCGACHNPHGSPNEKLLISGQPGLCFSCHDQQSYTSKKHVHPPVIGGMCTSCHDPHASEMPKLLTKDLPELCFTCHEKQLMHGRTIHAPVGVGMCGGCHATHQSDNAKLLLGQAPDLCYSCHEKAAFARKNIHAPVMSGMCLNCHRPHASDEISLVIKEPLNLCFDCHPKIRKTPHAVAGFQSVGHPLGIVKKGKKPISDPARPGKRFYCGSCHDPHSSESPSLYRYPADHSLALCEYCHKM